MPAAAWVTIMLAALIIAIAALGLLRVIFHLGAIRRDARRASSAACRSSPSKTSTVPDRLPSVNAT